jgi:hypothetical protein
MRETSNVQPSFASYGGQASNFENSARMENPTLGRKEGELLNALKSGQ